MAILYPRGKSNLITRYDALHPTLPCVLKGQRRKFHKEKEENFEEEHGYRRRKKWRMDDFPATRGDEGLLFVNSCHVFFEVACQKKFKLKNLNNKKSSTILVIFVKEIIKISLYLMINNLKK